ncbi:coiled-coil domain-containing protein [Litoreibacter arenae]|uniref:Uncharacterized protein n=1 Tax=Litoreibacter arenae DSM 19593 TaxID=1123360 RepID=S9QDD2_9RHOB|nr:hypothetical protein [Litoreibacter arenae]EPX77573.1 hypothetical protein thalar_03298 [Litoreibacter arenae DSM 19593]
MRPEDLLAVRIELRNLDVVAGDPPILKKRGTGASQLILHFPPQAITEEAFFQTNPTGVTGPDVDDTIELQKPDPDAGQTSGDTLPPFGGRTIRARIADESRLVFDVPNDLEIPYTLEGVLAAVQDLDLKVADNARPRFIVGKIFSVKDLLSDTALSRVTTTKRASLASFAANSLRISKSSTGAATLYMRQRSGGVGLLETGRVKPRFKLPGLLRTKPSPKPPAANTTAIEIPWRLILSPHKSTRWRHSTTAMTSAATTHTELWHSRLVSPNSQGDAIEPPYPDPSRTVRAIWAKTGEGSTPEAIAAAKDRSPDFENVDPSQKPFRMAMDDFDRTQISHLSSNFSISGHTPDPVNTNLMMMSALGGWLDSRGAWMPPGGFSVEEWAHRASMGRDHFVRVVYKGFLFPFGHQVSLVKVTERKFHNGALSDPKPGFPNGIPQIDQLPGNPAYMRQRMFIVIREKTRVYGTDTLRSFDGKVDLNLQFPFSTVTILTEATPNLDDPNDSEIEADKGQKFFWPMVNEKHFKFQCVATDMDDRKVAFELPMIFMDNTFAAPFLPASGSLDRRPNFANARANAVKAADAFAASGNLRTADMKLQRVALAASMKAGDTSVQVETMDFGGFAELVNPDLDAASDDLRHPPFYPMVTGLDARIGAMTHLSGSTAPNRLEWHPFYLKNGFDQAGEVFANVVPASGMAKLDFSAQGDRSGGFVQPNIVPKALSRLSGPVTAEPDQFINGVIDPGGGFPDLPGDIPLPLIFGCIPLNAIIDAVTGLADKPEKAPKFATEASTQLESFINGLVRLLGFVTEGAAQPANIANAALTAFTATLDDYIQQALGLTAAQATEIEDKLDDLKAELANVVADLATLLNKAIDAAPTDPGLANLPSSLNDARAAVDDLRNAANAQIAGVSLPAGLRQTILTTAQQLDIFLDDLAQLPVVVTQARALFDALDAIVGAPEAFEALLSDPDQLRDLVVEVGDKIDDLGTTLAGFNLMEGAPRKAITDAMSAVTQAIGIADDLLNLIEQLTGDELTIRFDWTPEISSFPSGPHPIFRVNDKRGFSLAVEAKVKKHGDTTPKISVVCGLKHFDLVLIGEAAFLELLFEKIEFSIDSAAKMDVDVVFNDIKFVGPLSFVEVLRDLIPLDGFSDPPFLDITPQGIDAGFSVALPSVNIGVLGLANLSLGAGFTVPFIGQPLSVRFNFCTREQPFVLTVYMFGGGGFFGVTIDPNGVQILEASFEFGASISIDLGVASGGVSVMAGIYFRMEQDAVSLTGYFRLAGHVDVLGIITASLELYLELRYEFETGKCVGKAELTIEISVFIFSGSVTISCERKFAGSNGDPNLRQMLGLNPALPLADELDQIDGPDVDYAWREHCEAFA